ncbi:catechol 2,3-dioxygenase [Geobacillus proteiniphilus]|uniref:Catechol 2,3-dioxygenase n=2 Tax=Geobacillus TaxID=129337 RepID=O68311_GEOTH|nr:MULTISPECIES: catechol 2,3-dioxygenase [Geobacillus]AAC38323.1 catechol 2,3-dioxygenase [Geobacillus thermoleovorans]OPX04573.1 catechol 2,3-dioxygenase [Geobacillus sp. LEMMY01]WMJ16245.1 catechol 2,3-dioxygenase [Geobacillus proteiniphilus]
MGEGIMRLGFVSVNVTDLEAARKHYVEVMGMQMTDRTENEIYLKGWDEYDHHSIVLRQSNRAGLDKMAFKVHTYEDMEQLEKQLQQYGASVQRVSKGENHKVGEGLRFRLPSGHTMELFVEMEYKGKALPQVNPAPWPEGLIGVGAPRIDHLLITAERPHETVDFLMKALNFYMSEKVVENERSETPIAAWLFRSYTPHDIAIIPGKDEKLHHFAFWLDEFNELRKAGDVFSKHDVPIDVGIERHGITRGQTIYYFDPSGNRNEVFTGGYIAYPDMPVVKWTVDQLARGIFYFNHRQEWIEGFTGVTT